MEDYSNIYECVGEEQRGYSTAANINKEEHQMVKVTLREVHEQTEINQCSTDRSKEQGQSDIKEALKATRISKCLILISALMAMTVLISIVAIVLSIISYDVLDRKMIDLKTEEGNTSWNLDQYNTYKMDMELSLMQLDNRIQQLNSMQNISQLSMIQTNLLINQLRDSISQLFICLNETRNEITSVATTVKSNISQLHIAINRLASSVQVEFEVTRIHCGAGVWHRVASLNMSDPLQQCPSAWREYNENNISACGRAVSSVGSCSSTSFSTISVQYNRVCGRIIGYQLGSADGFLQYANNDIDLDGINITHGAQRHHIWSYVAGFSEGSVVSTANCPCDTYPGRESPPSIGNNYYCESGVPAGVHTSVKLYKDDPLWDGQQCEDNCCIGTNSPPWFSVQLPTPTTDMIKVSINFVVMNLLIMKILQ